MCPFAVLTQPRRCNALIEVYMNAEQQEKVLDKISDVESKLYQIDKMITNVRFNLEDIEETFSEIEVDDEKSPDLVLCYERKNVVDFMFEHINNASYIKTQLLKQFKEDEILDIKVQFFVEKH